MPSCPPAVTAGNGIEREVEEEEGERAKTLVRASGTTLQRGIIELKEYGGETLSRPSGTRAPFFRYSLHSDDNKSPLSLFPSVAHFEFAFAARRSGERERERHLSIFTSPHARIEISHGEFSGRRSGEFLLFSLREEEMVTNESHTHFRWLWQRRGVFGAEL